MACGPTGREAGTIPPVPRILAPGTLLLSTPQHSSATQPNVHATSLEVSEMGVETPHDGNLRASAVSPRQQQVCRQYAYDGHMLAL